MGDALGRVLTQPVPRSTREFYVNDAGVQMDRFGASLMRVAANGEAVPEDGYHGAYVHRPGRGDRRRRPGDPRAAPRGAGRRLPGGAATARQLEQQQEVLDALRHPLRRLVLRADSLHESGAVDEAMATLREQGHVFDADGAVWLRTTDFGDDKDRVLVKADGDMTYFAADAAYYLDKRARGFDICIYMLGADHHGYVNRLKAIAACAGDDPTANIQVLIGQLVNLLEDGEPVRLSKRAGNIITLEDLVEWVGVDAARYSLARSNSVDSAADARRRRAHRAHQRQPGVLRAVRARADLVAAPRCRRPGHRHQ